MDRKEYTSCMTPHMKGTGKTKEQRQKDMCIGAKLCTGKASTREEAERICVEQAKTPKPSKPTGKKRKPQSCEKEVLKLSQCMMDYFEAKDLYKQILNVNTVGSAIANALMECQCEK